MRSLLDTDFYKLLMAQTIFRRHRDVAVTFGIRNRSASVRLAEIVDEAHVRQRDLFEELEHPGRGKLTTLKTPIVLSGKTAPLRRVQFKEGDKIKLHSGEQLTADRVEERNAMLIYHCGAREVTDPITVFACDDLEVDLASLRRLADTIARGDADVAAPRIVGLDGGDEATVRETVRRDLRVAAAGFLAFGAFALYLLAADPPNSLTAAALVAVSAVAAGLMTLTWLAGAISRFGRSYTGEPDTIADALAVDHVARERARALLA